ncbi:DUF1194 domain-containing protein [Kiloniella laminariae]|uniref:DUF1194 domain-containing protein n=1 Tax=Kiloniella laminariae TaxID=454162 RepID=A0ABT4LI51_9PROT|nr:DUF1194 domain-containing protein [Kiloniella laminariae]MCZ4280761.1 DUF1194 domain-containing protein [Kiloniella laminariae]
MVTPSLSSLFSLLFLGKLLVGIQTVAALEQSPAPSPSFPGKQDNPVIAVDLELVLAVDVSHSVDDYEASLQRQGYIDALRDPAVIEAITSGPQGRVAITYIEWAGSRYQHPVIGWSLLDSRESAWAFAQALESQPITSAPSTSISSIIDVAIISLFGNAYQGDRLVIDISGDGPNSDGRHVREARDDAIALGITINGLPVLSSRPNPNGLGPPSAWLDAYYIKNVIGGTNAFLMEVIEFENFGPALKEKLKREISGSTEISLSSGSSLPAHFSRHSPQKPP